MVVVVRLRPLDWAIDLLTKSPLRKGQAEPLATHLTCSLPFAQDYCYVPTKRLGKHALHTSIVLLFMTVM